MNVRRWCLDHARIYGTTPATLYALLMLALEPWWAELPPDSRAIMVTGLCGVDGDNKEEERLLAVQAMALTFYIDDERRMTGGLL